MTKRIFFLLLVCCAFSSNPMQAQKAKFKNLKATCQKTRLPQNYVEPENRTYDLYVKGSYSANVEPYNRGIFGWTLDSENPKMEAVVSLYGFRVNPAKRTSEKKEKKDKDGKVVERWTEYTYTGTAVGKGTLYIYGESNPFVYKKKDDEKSKAELKREAEEAEKKKELEANPFLSSEDVAAAEEEEEDSDIGEDSGLDGAMLPLVETVGLDVSESVTTRANRSATAAYKDYRENQRPKLYNLRDNYPTRSYNRAMNSLNYQYGYSPVNYSIWLKQMKSDKHSEFKMWNDACQATATLFKTFSYNQSIADMQAKFDPIIGYFTEQMNSIDDSDRKGKNMRKAAFNNVINILYYLDRYDEVIALCEANLDSKFLDKMAKRMLNKANRQKALMEFHKLESCHMEGMNDVVDGEIETEEEETDAADDDDGN